MDALTIGQEAWLETAPSASSQVEFDLLGAEWPRLAAAFCRVQLIERAWDSVRCVRTVRGAGNGMGL